MQYKKAFAKTARDILSKPFKSKQHVCQAIGITVKIFDEWLLEIEEFEQAVHEGFLNGEVKARNFLMMAAGKPNIKIDIRAYENLARDIYGIGSGTGGEAANDEPVKWVVEFVKAGSKNTEEAGTVPN